MGDLRHLTCSVTFLISSSNADFIKVTDERNRLFRARVFDQKVKVSSSATKKIGLPPVEIDTAWAKVSFAP